MERLVRIAKKLREEHRFNGYIHLKTIPKASPEILHEAGLYADRLSVNMEIPTVSGLKLLAPEKKHSDMTQPMAFVRNEIVSFADSRKTIKSTPKFAPAGQSTQFIIGAAGGEASVTGAGEPPRQTTRAAGGFYRHYGLKRVYYSGYVPVLEDKRLPPLSTQVPLRRENRLYQADWLMRFYGFSDHEILDDQQPFLDLDFDPKLAWALRHREWFPVPLQHAPLEIILRVPGIGVKSARKIVQARRFRMITMAQLSKMGVALNRARYFITLPEPNRYADLIDSPQLRGLLLQNTRSKFSQSDAVQTDLFG